MRAIAIASLAACTVCQALACKRNENAQKQPRAQSEPKAHTDILHMPQETPTSTRTVARAEMPRPEASETRSQPVPGGMPKAVNEADDSGTFASPDVSAPLDLGIGGFDAGLGPQPAGDGGQRGASAPMRTASLRKQPATSTLAEASNQSVFPNPYALPGGNEAPYQSSQSTEAASSPSNSGGGDGENAAAGALANNGANANIGANANAGENAGTGANANTGAIANTGANANTSANANAGDNTNAGVSLLPGPSPSESRSTPSGGGAPSRGGTIYSSRLSPRGASTMQGIAIATYDGGNAILTVDVDGGVNGTYNVRLADGNSCSNPAGAAPEVSSGIVSPSGGGVGNRALNNALEDATAATIGQMAVDQAGHGHLEISIGGLGWTNGPPLMTKKLLIQEIPGGSSPQLGDTGGYVGCAVLTLMNPSATSG
jgi:hypothetical protein